MDALRGKKKTEQTFFEIQRGRFQIICKREASMTACKEQRKAELLGRS